MSSEQREEADYDKQLEEKNAELTRRDQLERGVRIAEMAQKTFNENKGRFKIRLKIPTGNKIQNPLGETEDEYKENEHEVKTYYFRRVTSNDWNLYRMKLAELNNEAAKPFDQVDNMKIVDLNARIYEFLALKYLGIKHDDFIRAEWDDLQLAVDVCGYITNAGTKDFEVSNIDERPLGEIMHELREEDKKKKIGIKPNGSSSIKYYEYDQ